MARPPVRPVSAGEHYAWTRWARLVPAATPEQLSWALQVLLVELDQRALDHLVVVCTVHGVAIGTEAFCAECVAARCVGPRKNPDELVSC